MYSSDHGYSLGENGFFGNASKDPLAQKEQKDIAMFMWGSDYFIEKNPGLIDKIRKHSEKRVSQDYIFHSILDCSGVKSDYIHSSLSLCR
jgi:glucan phosphoethanolaminetransferase (alkaline phosphatase superfamily)